MLVEVDLRVSVDKKGILEDKLGVAGLLGLCIIAVIQLISIKTLNAPLWVSLCCFAVAIPLLAGYFFMLESQTRFQVSVTKWYENLIGYAGIIIGFAGIAGLFWHFSWVVSVIFVILSVIVIILWTDFDDALIQASKKQERQEPQDE